MNLGDQLHPAAAYPNNDADWLIKLINRLYGHKMPYDGIEDDNIHQYFLPEINL